MFDSKSDIKIIGTRHGEKIVRDYKDPSFTWAIVRPTSVWGPHIFGPFLTFFKLINKGYYFHPGKKQKIKPKKRNIKNEQTN